MTAAHIHRLEYRRATSTKYPDLAVPMIASPSISPVYDNNPAYTTMHFGLN